MQTQEIKGNLARLLATENLIVEHRKTATASFDVDRRLLTLPMWDKASGVVYDMLVGHEVGHALFTPNKDWRDAVDCPKDFVNVIEDARIEKLMKRKFPGLRKSFNGGYKELNNLDFFEIVDQNLDNFSLIDRINLHFKIGASAFIPFGASEIVFVERTEKAETFAEVLQIAFDVYQFSNQTETPMTHEEMLEVAHQRENENSKEEENTQVSEDQFENSSVPQQDNDYKEDYYDEEEDSSGKETSQTQRSFDNSAENLSSRHGRSPV